MSSKQVYLFIPPETITMGHPTVENLREKFPPRPTDDFQDFYNKRIARYSSKPPKTFCNMLEDLIPEFAVEENMVTLISMNDKDVFAVLIFKINHPVSDLYIEILCGNKALPSTGEGTKLLKILENAGNETDQFNIDLSDIDLSYIYTDTVGNGFPNDQFAFSSSDNMDYYCSLYDRIDEYYNEGFRNFVGERLLKHHLKDSRLLFTDTIKNDIIKND